MYEWLPDALQGGSTVVTANRRLARTLRQEFAQQRLQAGELAWRSPDIHSWQDWLENLLQSAADQDALPTKINQHQSQILWERCLSAEVDESFPGLTGLVRISRDVWQRLADWHTGIREVARAAENNDQRLYARAAGRYVAMLEREQMVDDAGLAGLVLELLRGEQVSCATRITFAGFDRERPIQQAISAVLADRGCTVAAAPLPERAESLVLQSFAGAAEELRAAGAWARARLEEKPACRVAIVADKLAQESIGKARLVREGLVPGWQYGPPSVAQSLNVSYGRNLAEFPAVSVALRLLKWLVKDLSAGDVSLLLRTSLLGPGTDGERSRLELRLRQLPDRKWSPSMLGSALRAKAEPEDAPSWRAMLAWLTKQRHENPGSASPADWALYIDKFLVACGWPGKDPLPSVDFQLVNRWRELLNEFARLDLVSPRMSLSHALQRVELMAADTVFQAESECRAVHLLGPLEAAGAEFDALWVSGLTATNWPPSGSPSPLVSRRLQRQLCMPDADATETVAYAKRLIARLAGSATDIVLSYALTEDDAEQTPSELLQPLAAAAQAAAPDPGWHASRLSKIGHTVVVDDVVPGIRSTEKISGGAGTIQRQLDDPVTAFITGRLGVRSLQPQAKGLPAALRGNIIHDALFHLYRDKPDSETIRAWRDDELTTRIQGCLASAFYRQERDTDAVLLELFKLERLRVADLLRQFVGVDREREAFAVAELEHEVLFAEADVGLQLRVDRIDRLGDGSLSVLDYKTGAKKKFLRGDGQPQEIQLVAYACALDGLISALALVNVDTREVNFDGAGRGYTDPAAWNETLAEWKRRVAEACVDLSRGDVRINRLQGIADARAFNLLSRYTELRHDG